MFPQIAGKLLRFLLLIGQVFGGELFSLLLHRVLCKMLTVAKSGKVAAQGAAR
jgi:hypothetical protein